MMRQYFEKWMKAKENKKPNTAYQYASSIDKISRHFSQSTRQPVDIYQESDLSLIEKIATDYAIGGRFSDFGNGGNGTIRNAIATYVRFLRATSYGRELSLPEETGEPAELATEFLTSEEDIAQPTYNFTYEKDLKNALISQASQLFPGYTIYGENQEGIEFPIDGKRIDLLLENTSDQSLLAVELKSGSADFRVFGQISMYLGLLSKRFPDRISKGIIVAGEIDDTLRNACLTTDKITLKTYQMQLTLTDS